MSDTIGKLPPRYSFLLNPYTNVRLSKCPQCKRLTYLRKFALLIHVTGTGPLALGKTCRYCPRCELICAHQDELEAALARHFGTESEAGTDYQVLGTMNKKFWKEGMRRGGTRLGPSLEHIAEFRRVFKLKVSGGWGSDPKEASRSREGVTLFSGGTL